jgi:integrase
MARLRQHDGVVFRRKESKVWWIRYRDRNGIRRRESTLTEDWNEAQQRLRKRLQARDDNILDTVKKGESMSFGEWADFFLEYYSKPPLRADSTHEINVRVTKHLKPVFGMSKLVDITADKIELYLRRRLRQRIRIKTALGYREGGVLQAATVHQEFRVLRRMLNVAVRKKLLLANPCSGVEFPVRVKGLFRPHYMSWSEQQRIQAHAPEHLRNIITIITETGLRVFKELLSMKKDQLDLPNACVWIPDSKTPNGIAEVPLTPLAVQAFRNQLAISGSGPFLFPSELNPTGHQRTLNTAWHKTLRRAGVAYFRIYDLRSTYATRLSAGGVADEWVIQLLRQGDSHIFKKYSQMKLQMKREALEKINRRANEMSLNPGVDPGTAMIQ